MKASSSNPTFSHPPGLLLAAVWGLPQIMAEMSECVCHATWDSLEGGGQVLRVNTPSEPVCGVFVVEPQKLHCIAPAY